MGIDLLWPNAIESWLIETTIFNGEILTAKIGNAQLEQSSQTMWSTDFSEDS